MNERQAKDNPAPEPVAHMRKETGQALAEYSLILAFIAAACILALGALGLALSGELDAVTAAFP